MAEDKRTTEKNWFDDYLKEHLWRDIVFRLIVLITITGSTLFFAAQTTNFSALAYLEKSGKTIGPVLNTVGLFALFLAICALMFKDLDHQSPRWSQQTKVGKLGAFVRRIASDLMLWMMGIFGTLLCITGLATVAVWRTSDLTLLEGFQLGYIYALLILGVGVTAFMNILIRKPTPPLAGFEPWAKLSNSPAKTIGFYIGSAVAIGAFALLT